MRQSFCVHAGPSSAPLPWLRRSQARTKGPGPQGSTGRRPPLAECLLNDCVGLPPACAPFGAFGARPSTLRAGARLWRSACGTTALACLRAGPKKAGPCGSTATSLTFGHFHSAFAIFRCRKKQTKLASGLDREIRSA